MKKALPYLLVLAMLPLLYGCPHNLKCGSCTQVYLNLQHPGDSLQTDSVHALLPESVNGLGLYLQPRNGTDSSFFTLQLDMPRDSSTFVFYHAQHPADTLVFRHSYVRRYREDCEQYYFELLNLEVVRSTFLGNSLTPTEYQRPCYNLKSAL